MSVKVQIPIKMVITKNDRSMEYIDIEISEKDGYILVIYNGMERRFSTEEVFVDYSVSGRVRLLEVPADDSLCTPSECVLDLPIEHTIIHHIF